MLYKNVPKLAEILNGKFSVKKENLSLGPFGLELEVEPEELERYTSKGTLGLAMPIYFEDNNQKKRLTIIIFPKKIISIYTKETEDTRNHEREHIIQSLQAVFNPRLNLAKVLTLPEVISKDYIPETYFIEEETEESLVLKNYESLELYISTNKEKINDIDFLKLLRNRCLINVKKEIFSHLIESTTFNELIPQVPPSLFLKNIFRYEYNFSLQLKPLFEKYGLRTEVWGNLMEDEYYKIIDNGIDAFFSLVVLKNNKRDSNEGVSVDEAISFFSMYSLEDWPKMAMRYNTRKIDDIKIVGHEKFYIRIKNVIELMKNIVWYPEAIKFLKSIKFKYIESKIELNNHLVNIDIDSTDIDIALNILLYINKLMLLEIRVVKDDTQEDSVAYMIIEKLGGDYNDWKRYLQNKYTIV
jgi:hypothetical protein